MTERLLVFGDDGSPGADLAWRWIDAQRWPGWRVEVLTAALPPPGPPLDPREVEPHPWNPPQERRPSLPSEIASVRHLEAKSDPRLALLRADADLLVIGPRGGGMLKTLHIGSTAEYLLHHPPAPLLIARAPQPVVRVLVCVDGSSHSQRAAEALAAMPWAADTKVWILGVEDGRSDLDRGLRQGSALLENTVEELSERRVSGPVPWAILRQADELDVDLIVMGTRGLLGIRRLVLGSTASAVVRAARCSVLCGGNAS